MRRESAAESGSLVKAAATARELDVVLMLDRALVAAGWIGAVLPTVALLLIIVFLVHSAFPSVLYNGLHFLTGTEWNLGNLYVSTTTVRNGVKAAQGASYGALPLVLGTLLSSIIALVIGVPIAVASALVIVERLPRSWNVPFSVALELLAGFPSVVYGLWGLIVLGPFLAHYTYPTLARVLGFIPFLGGQTGSGLGLLTSGIVLAVMIIPIVAATTRDLLTQVPPPTREGALALGFTGWETARLVSLPWIRAGIFGACILGWARALGETMAVLMVSGSAANTIPSNIYGPVSTIAATIVALLDSALTDPTGLAQSALAEAGLLLFLITFGSNILARVILRRAGGTALPVGRGI